MFCSKCRCDKAIKNGTLNQKQRYNCKNCGCNFTQSTLSRTPVAKHIEALKLYLEGVGFRGIERLTGIPHSTLILWVKNLGVEIERLRSELTEQVMKVELYEM